MNYHEMKREMKDVQDNILHQSLELLGVHSHEVPAELTARVSKHPEVKFEMTTHAKYILY